MIVRMSKTCTAPGCIRPPKNKSGGMCGACVIRQRRQDPEYKARDLARDREHQTSLRQNPEVREKQRKRMEDKRQDPAFTEEMRQYLKEYRSDPIRKEKHREYIREYRKDPVVRTRINENSRASRCFFPRDLVDACRSFQNGCCALCSVVLVLTKTAYRECADHCHDSNTPRGLLCSVCNSALGFYEKHQRPNGLLLQPYEDYIENTPVMRLGESLNVGATPDR